MFSNGGRQTHSPSEILRPSSNGLWWCLSAAQRRQSGSLKKGRGHGILLITSSTHRICRIGTSRRRIFAPPGARWHFVQAPVPRLLVACKVPAWKASLMLTIHWLCIRSRGIFRTTTKCSRLSHIW